MFCKSCGKEFSDDSMFCTSCGAKRADENSQNAKEEKENIVLECKGSLQGGGVGRIIVTNKNIIWTKSKGANLLMGGLLTVFTKGDTSVSFNQILRTNKYLFLGGGGLQIFTNLGKNYKFGFNSSKDRDFAMEYINNQIK